MNEINYYSPSAVVVSKDNHSVISQPDQQNVDRTAEDYIQTDLY